MQNIAVGSPPRTERLGALENEIFGYVLRKQIVKKLTALKY
jgi:hypothetical protein